MTTTKSTTRGHQTLGRSATVMIVLTLFALGALTAVTLVGGDLLEVEPREVWAGWLSWAFASEPWWFALALGMVFVGVQLLASPRLHGGGAGEQSVRNWIAGITMAAAAGTIAAWLLAMGIGTFWALTVRPLDALPVAAVAFTGFATALVAAGGVLAGRYYLPRDVVERLTGELRELEREQLFRAEDFRGVSRDRPWVIGLVGALTPALLITGLALLVDATVPSFPATSAALALVLLLTSLTMLIDTPGYAQPQRGLILGLAWFLHVMSSAGVALMGGSALAIPLADAPLWIANTLLLIVLLALFLLSLWAGLGIQRRAQRHGFQNRMLAWTFPFVMLVLSSRSASDRLSATRRELHRAAAQPDTDPDDIDHIRRWLVG